MAWVSLSLSVSSQATERRKPPGVFCQRQQQWQRQWCRGQQDRDQSGHTSVTCGRWTFPVERFSLQTITENQHVSHNTNPLHNTIKLGSDVKLDIQILYSCIWVKKTRYSVYFILFIFFANIKKTLDNLLCSPPEQTKLLVVRPGHRRGGFRPVRWLQRLLAGAAKTAGGSQGGVGTRPTHGSNAGGSGAADPAAQTFPCGWSGQLVKRRITHWESWVLSLTQQWNIYTWIWIKVQTVVVVGFLGFCWDGLGIPKFQFYWLELDLVSFLIWLYSLLF